MAYYGLWLIAYGPRVQWTLTWALGLMACGCSLFQEIADQVRDDALGGSSHRS